MENSTLRILAVDDYEAWRRFVCSTLQEWMKSCVVVEAADGLAGLWKAQELQPDLVILDIGLPKLNGIEVARRILKSAPDAKVLFVSEQRSLDIVEEALRTGARGYVVKSDAATELLRAVEAVLQGKQFVSASLTLGDPENERTARNRRHDNVPQTSLPRRHEVGFYSDDRRLLDDVTQFIGAALKAGNAAIVVAIESHRNNLLPRLQAQGVDVATAIEQARYVAMDVKDALSAVMVDDMLDPVRFMKTFGRLIATAAKAAMGKYPRVAVFGEGTHLLWTQGNVNAAIQDEQLCNELTKIYNVDILCGYCVGRVQAEMDPHIFKEICTQHSAVHSR